MRRFLRLAAVERRLLVEAALLLQAARLGLWLLPFRTLRGLFGRLARRPLRPGARERCPREMVVWAVEALGRSGHPKTTCLTLALATQVMLVRRGYPAVVRIGVVRGGARLEAHAWVESDGRTLVGDLQLRRYTPLAALMIEDS